MQYEIRKPFFPTTGMLCTSPTVCCLGKVGTVPSSEWCVYAWWLNDLSLFFF